VAGFEVDIRLGDPSAPAADPANLVVAHHVADRAQVRAEVLSGGHLLHLAVAGCLFNDILREAEARGIELTDLQISADGDFQADPLTSTGITYSIDLAGSASEDELRELAAGCAERGAIPQTLERGTEVRPTAIRVRARD
jgi:uncharacterized OsmC-like protein